MAVKYTQSAKTFLALLCVYGQVLGPVRGVKSGGAVTYKSTMSADGRRSV